MSRGTKINRNNILDEAGCKFVHEGSCKILNELGVKVDSPQAVDIFQKGGAIYDDGRIKIPKQMVEEAVHQTAQKMVLGAKNPDNNIQIDAETPVISFGTGGQALYVLHYQDGGFEKKPAVTQDLIDIIRICEQLDHVDFITRPVEPEVSEEEIDLRKTQIFLENTTKHINLANLIRLEKLSSIIQTVQNKSLISFISGLIVSPLNLVSHTVEKFIRIVEEDIPVAISSCPQGGTTAPLSEVGELIQVNAEVLSAVVLANLVRPGAKVFYRGIPITSNLYTDGSPRWSQPESIRRIAQVSDLCYFYKIPCCGTTAVSDEKEPNPQTLAEKTLGWVFESASGAQFINSALGMLEQVLTVCPEQYIIDNKVIAHVKKLLTRSSDYEIGEIAQTAVTDALEVFGVNMNAEIKEDIQNRIEFILSGKEAFTPEYVNAQVDVIQNAVLSGRSSNKFMKASRSGIRQGWLYTGKKVEGELDLQEVFSSKEELLSQ